MSAQVIRVCADGRRLVRDDELARLVRDIEHHCERAPGARSGYDGGGDRSEKQLRAIAERAPEQVRELYRKGLLGQKEAAKLGPKNPNPASTVRDRRGPRG